MDLCAEDGPLTPVLRTERLTLRPIVLSDAEAIMTGVGNWDIVKWLAVVPHPYTLEDAHHFITDIVPNTGRHWAIDDGAFAGIITLGKELGYWLSEDRWGRGYMTEAGKAVVDHHFADPATGDLTSGYFVANERSGAVLTKLGFVAGHERRLYCLVRGYEVDSQSMVLTRARWQDLSNSGLSANAGA
jgi:RimJ/RimL family protein N-acetyltransferase